MYISMPIYMYTYILRGPVHAKVLHLLSGGRYEHQLLAVYCHVLHNGAQSPLREQEWNEICTDIILLDTQFLPGSERRGHVYVCLDIRLHVCMWFSILKLLPIQKCSGNVHLYTYIYVYIYSARSCACEGTVFFVVSPIRK